MKKITWILLLLISSISIQAQRLSDRESNFFNINNFNNQSNVITIRNFTGQNNGRDSQILNDAIRRASNAGGGVIVITSPRSGNSIYLRSIVLIIDPNFLNVLLTRLQLLELEWLMRLG